MKKFYIVTIILLGIILADATGDAFRFKGWMLLHHSMEVIQIGGFLILWKLYGFRWAFVLLYILARLWLFDIVYNLICGFHLLYVGTTDPVDKGIRGFAYLVRQNYMHFSFMIKFIALVSLIGVFIRQLRNYRA